MPVPPPLPLPFANVPFTTAEAQAAGLSYARLRRADLAAPFRGVRAVAVPRTLMDRTRAFAPNLRPGHAFSGASAGALWGMWLPLDVERESPVEVLAVHPARAPRMSGVRGHHAANASLSLLDGMPLTDPAETWCELGTTLSLDDLVAAGDSLVRRQAPRCSLAELVAAVERRGGRRGVAVVRLALPLVRAGCDSARETRLRLLLTRAGLPEPEVNGVVSKPGARVRFGDLVFRAWKVIAEYDGEHHRLSVHQFASDVTRFEELTREGWTIIRVLAAHFDAPKMIVERVTTALRDGGWSPERSRSHVLRVSYEDRQQLAFQR